MSTGRLVIAIILVLLGLSALAGNLGILDWDYLAGLWHLWPLLLVIIGIGLLFGRRRRGLGLLLIALVVLVGVALAVFAIDEEDRRLTDDRFTGPPVGGLESARILGDLGALDLEITSHNGGPVVEADFRVRGRMEVSDTGPAGDYEVEFSQKSGGWFFPLIGGDEHQSGDIRLAEGIPWDIDLDIGAADVNIDLSRVTLSSLEIDAGASSIDVRLGEEVIDGAEVGIDGGARSFTIAVPESLRVVVRTDTGLSSNDLDERFDEVGDDEYLHDGGGPEVVITLRAGVSSLNVDLY